MRFDNIAQAAMTPGGFNAGANDMIQALLGAKANKAKLAQQGEQQAWERGFQERKLSADITNNLTNQGYRGREVAANEMRAQTDQGLAGNTIANTWADNIGSVGKYIGDKLMPDAGRAGGGTPANDLAREKWDAEKAKNAEDKARAQANLEVFGNPDGQAQDVQDEPMTDLLGQPRIDPKTGKILTTGNKKYVKRLPTKEESMQAEAAYRRLMAERTTSLPGSGVASARTAPQAGDTNGLSKNESPTGGAPASLGSQLAGSLAPAPAIDYAAEDARLQATDPQYRQYRSNPQFNWKAAIDATRAQGQ